MSCPTARVHSAVLPDVTFETSIFIMRFQLHLLLILKAIQVLVHHVQELRRSVEKKFGGLEDVKQANLSSDSLEWEGHPSRGGHDPVSTPSNHLPPSEEIEVQNKNDSVPRDR